MSSEVKDFILKCEICRSVDKKQPKETLIPYDVPDRPWAKVGVDLFNFNKTNYLIIVDYFSGFWEIDPLENTTASHIIRKMKMQFARHGIQISAFRTTAHSLQLMSTRSSASNGNLS